MSAASSAIIEKPWSRARDVLGVHIDIRHGDEVIETLDSRLDSGEPLGIFYANAHTVNSAWKMPDVIETLNNGIVLNDGLGVDLASRLLYGESYPENLNGTDFTPRFIGNSRHSLRIFLLGSRPGVADETARRWREMFPYQEIVGVRHGHFSKSETESVIREIRDSGANFLIVGMGNPLQEQWIGRYMAETGVTLAIGVGALFDFVSESVPRAPVWVRRLRSEWLFRLFYEPRRMFRRYVIGNWVFLYRVLRQKRSLPSA